MGVSLQGPIALTSMVKIASTWLNFCLSACFSGGSQGNNMGYHNSDGRFDTELTHARITPNSLSRSNREIARYYVQT